MYFIWIESVIAAKLNKFRSYQEYDDNRELEE